MVAAAVVLPDGCEISGADDSKLLSYRRRVELATTIRSVARGWSVAAVAPRVIDRCNIHRAAFAAMRRAVMRLALQPGVVLADGWAIPHLPFPCQGVVGGDGLSQSIACASIIAKVCRDRMMIGFDRLHPTYGFAFHKGYPTARHLQALRANGPSPIHRRTFAPVAECTRPT